LQTESMTMLTWALEHPYLYTIIKLKPALVAVACAMAIKATVQIIKGGR
jgi:hypothetical protein